LLEDKSLTAACSQWAVLALQGALIKISRTAREKRVVRLRKMIKPEADRAGTGI
jgi:hypothetical protein